jgi:hypothetical protein
MRILSVMAAIVAFASCLSAQHAHAQGMGQGMGRGRHHADAPKSNSKATKADEKAYRDALKSIPEKKVDPWGNMR